MLIYMYLLSCTSIALFGSQVFSQPLNSPPIIYMNERNWRISENERVGQVIARIRAEGGEDDELFFGLEPRLLLGNFHDNSKGNVLPFRIDPLTGTVYLNESVKGRAGENILLYVTVTNGQYSAKSEVLVNILSDTGNINSTTKIHTPVLAQKGLPSLESLLAAQSIRNNQNKHLVTYNNRSPLFSGNLPYYHPTFENPLVQNNAESNKYNTENMETSTKLFSETSNRTFSNIFPTTPTSTQVLSINTSENSNTTLQKVNHDDQNHKAVFSSKSTYVLSIVAVAFLMLAVSMIAGVTFRKNFCKYRKNVPVTSKEHIAKISTQTNGHGGLRNDAEHSMVLQNWSGPIANNNRYVPWERDHPTEQNEITVFQSMGNSENDFDANLSNTQTSQGYTDRWEYPRHRLKFYNILGEGAFGQVWKCQAVDIGGETGTVTVAVKTLRENATEAEKKDLVSELEVMKKLEPHINVVQLLACCTEKDPTFVILEYVNRGKLQTFLRQSRAERHYGNTHGGSNYLTSTDLTSFMYQVAKGMDFLTNKGIIHRDLAARNVLINDENICKVADFGFARDIVSSKIYERKSEGKLPIRWMAIESLYDNLFSVKSDIWSFGILMWEIVTLGSTPYPGISAGEVMKKVRDGFRLEKPEHCRRELYNIMYYCWSRDPNERPIFSDIVDMLEKLLHTEKDYIELERFPDHNYYNILSLSNEKV